MRKIIRFIPTLLWMMTIFYFSSIPTSGVPGNNFQRFLILKSFHLIEYAVLSILLFISLRDFKKTIIIAYLYACSDEFHQSFVIGRTSKFSDTLIDLVGIILGLLFIQTIISLHQKNRYTKE